MNLLNDLSSDLAMAILVEKKHAARVTRNEGVKLIGKVRDALQTVADDETAAETRFLAKKASKSPNN